MMQLAILGGGHMGEALIGGLLANGTAPESIAVAETMPERRHHLESTYPGIRVVASPAWAVADASVIVVAVKPPDVTSVIEGCIDAMPEHVVIVSIAAGIRTDAIEAVAGARPVVRAMPNTPALVGEGATAIAPGATATTADLAAAEHILGAVGLVVRVTEPMIDAVTAISGSGPAYIFLLAEALIDAAVAEGLDRELATELVNQTVLGAGRMLVDNDATAEQLRAMVTSPGGTTAAACRELESGGLREVVRGAVAAARQRSEEMGR